MLEIEGRELLSCQSETLRCFVGRHRNARRLEGFTQYFQAAARVLRHVTPRHEQMDPPSVCRG